MRFTLEQALALEEKGARVAVLDTAALAPTPKGLDSFENLELLRLRHPGSATLHPWEFSRSVFQGLRRLSRSWSGRRFDGALFSFADHKHLSVLPWVHRRAAKVGVLAHGVDVMPGPMGVRQIGTELLLKQADLLFAVSRFTASLASHWVDKPVRLAVNGVRLEKLAEAKRMGASAARVRLGWEGPTLLSVANLVPRKGLDLVLEALAKLAQRGLEFRHHIVGRGPERARLQRQARHLRLEDRVDFEDAQLSDAELALRYAACDVFVLLSRSMEQPPGVEGFGLVYAEAQAVGRPVVGGRSGGVPEVVKDGETGFLINPERPDAVEQLANRLAELLVDPSLRARMGQAGRAWVESQFTWSRHAEQILAGFET
ncbi:MAG: glycosyltransferase family 4 protein [Myxococcota bacterium]